MPGIAELLTRNQKALLQKRTDPASSESHYRVAGGAGRQYRAVLVMESDMAGAHPRCHVWTGQPLSSSSALRAAL